MDLKRLATQMLMQRLSVSNNARNAESALGDLLDTGKDFDLGNIAGQFSSLSGGTADKLQSWLGDGDNDALTPDEFEHVIGSGKINDFARRLGIGTEEAKDALADVVPQLIDKASSGGSLLGSDEVSSMLGGLASKAFQ